MTKTVKNILATTLLAILGVSTVLFASFTGTKINEAKADEQPYLETEAEFIKTGATYKWNDVIDARSVTSLSSNNTIKFGKKLLFKTDDECASIYFGSQSSGICMANSTFGDFEEGYVTVYDEYKVFSFVGEEEGKITGTMEGDIDYYTWFRQNAIRVQKIIVKSGETVLKEVEIPADTLINFGDYVSATTISELDQTKQYQFRNETGNVVYSDNSVIRTSDDLTVYVSETIEEDSPIVEESNLGDKISDAANNVSAWLKENTGVAISSGSLIVAAIIVILIMLTKRK